MKLELDLVPRTAWYSNVRSMVSRSEWDVIRKKSYALAGGKCEICGASGFDQGFPHALECHERWEYDSVMDTQRLVGLLALCPLCHKVKHWGLAVARGEERIVRDHLMAVNDMRHEEIAVVVLEAFRVWKKRNETTWDTDISYIKEYMKEAPGGGK